MELELAEGWIEGELAEEFPQLGLVHAPLAARPGRSPLEVKQRLRQLANRYTGGHVIHMRQDAVPWAYRVFARQVEALCRPGDLLVLHSTSGESPNLLAAAQSAREGSVATVAFLGRGGGALASRVDHAIVVPSDDTGRIQVIQLALEHLIVELVEEELARGA